MKYDIFSSLLSSVIEGKYVRFAAVVQGNSTGCKAWK
ncbi:hypothetical protein MLOOGBEN_08580 [Bacillus sp. EB106-08-02-XG196]|nr:hypothetical protein [Bacillus sp. EB106-08-02-XG196]